MQNTVGIVGRISIEVRESWDHNAQGSERKKNMWIQSKEEMGIFLWDRGIIK